MNLLRVRIEITALKHYWIAAIGGLIVWATICIFANRIFPDPEKVSWWPVSALMLILDFYLLLLLTPTAIVRVFGELRAPGFRTSYLSQPASRLSLFGEKLFAVICFSGALWLVCQIVFLFAPAPTAHGFDSLLGAVPTMLALSYLISLSIGPLAALVLPNSALALIITTCSIVGGLLLLETANTNHLGPAQWTIPSIGGLNISLWLGCFLLLSLLTITALSFYRRMEADQ